MRKKKIIIVMSVIILLIIVLMPLDIPHKVLKMLYPIKYESFVEFYSEKYNVDKYLVYAVIKAESNFNNDAVSSKDAKGLMQLMQNTAKDISKKLEITLTDDEIKNKLSDPEFNINLGTKYISVLIEKYNCIELALVAYNAGSGNVDTWIEQGILNKDGSNIEQVPYKETNNYARKILRDYKIYINLYN